MDIAEFVASFALEEPSREWKTALKALWWDARGDWDQAHALAQADEADRQCAWVHAYLHRKEGDLANAAYWFRRAGRPSARDELEAEWIAIAAALLHKL